MSEAIHIEKVILRQLRMKLKHPFTTSFGTTEWKDFLVIELQDEAGRRGWGECVAMNAPTYNEETVETCRHMMKQFLTPLLKEQAVPHPDDVSRRFSPIRGNHMAKAALEGAVWDVYAKRQGLSLSRALGGRCSQIDVGISIGIQPSIEQMLTVIGDHIASGYKRIKIKIKPGQDVSIIRAIRERYPDIPLMADANSAYTLDDIAVLRQLDAFNLMMIEQPLGHDDIIDHATLQQQINTPICLDESIRSAADARKAIELGSCRVINVKIGRVGGLSEAKAIHDVCLNHHMDAWCGGMLEAGIGRAHNIALTTLPGFTLPGDTAASARYWQEDIITPEVTTPEGVIHVPEQSGMGYTVDTKRLDRYTTETEIL